MRFMQVQDFENNIVILVKTTNEGKNSEITIYSLSIQWKFTVYPDATTLSIINMPAQFTAK